MLMNRRDFLVSLAAPVAAGIMAPQDFLNERVVPKETITLAYPLVSTPGKDGLDRTYAPRARKAAEYVLTRGQQRGLSRNYDFHREPGFEHRCAEFGIDDWHYFVDAFNVDEKKPPEHYNFTCDSISFQIDNVAEVAFGNPALYGPIFLKDEGLTGMCTSGDVHIVGADDFTFSSAEGKGMEHFERVQKYYRTAIDRLIAFYERTTAI